MLNWFALACLAGAVALLYALSVRDLKTRLLPDEMVLGFATLGFVFHLTTLAQFVSIPNIALGGIAGFSILYVMRFAANRFFGEYTLGLGDVKLMGAAGIWLGPDALMLAMAAGASIALLHGIVYGVWSARRTGARVDFSNFKVPAGPGFAAGIIIAGILQFWHFRLRY
jgi:leader peptidase (prepilin peptidase) / N-methyltransferase